MAESSRQGKARSPIVDRRVDGTVSVDVLADRRRRRASTSVVRWCDSPCYGGSDGPEHTTWIWFSLKILTSEVPEEEELCVPISLPSTLIEQRRSAETVSLQQCSRDTSQRWTTEVKLGDDQCAEQSQQSIRCQWTAHTTDLSQRRKTGPDGCSDVVSVKVDPRSRTSDTGNTDVLPTRTGSLGIWCWWRAEEHYNTSGLPRLICNRLAIIEDITSSMQTDMRPWRASISDGWQNVM